MNSQMIFGWPQSHIKRVNGITGVNVNHNRTSALERSLINNGRGRGGLNYFYMAITTPLASAVVHNICELFGPSGESLTSQYSIKNKQINYDNYNDESKTRTHRFSKLPDDGDT